LFIDKDSDRPVDVDAWKRLAQSIVIRLALLIDRCRQLGAIISSKTYSRFNVTKPREATLPCYRSEPLDTAVDFVEHAVLRLHLAAFRAGCSAAGVFVRRGTRRHRAPRDRRGIAGATPEAVALPAELSGKLSVLQVI